MQIVFNFHAILIRPGSPTLAVPQTISPSLRTWGFLLLLNSILMSSFHVFILCTDLFTPYREMEMQYAPAFTLQTRWRLYDMQGAKSYQYNKVILCTVPVINSGGKKIILFYSILAYRGKPIAATN